MQLGPKITLGCTSHNRPSENPAVKTENYLLMMAGPDACRGKLYTGSIYITVMLPVPLRLENV